MPVVAALYRYPVKGARRVELTAAEVRVTGFAGDREFMVVEPDGEMITQREIPALATVDPDDLDVVAAPIDGPVLDVHHHKWSGTGIDQGDEVAARLTDHLGTPVRLVRFTPGQVRRTTRGDGTTMYADGYPIHVVSTASLADLNTRLDVPVPMTRFRPNVVLDGVAKPWVEDGWSGLRMGAVRLDLVKWCDRCVVTTVDQDRGTKDSGDGGSQPLKELGRFRAKRLVDGSRGIVFGQNAVPRRLGTISVGDEVEVS